MSDQISDILLQEFRALQEEVRQFRDDVAAWKLETGERVKALETTVEDALIDNGQPSRMTAVERKVTVLERITWIASGVLLSVQAAVDLLGDWRPWTHR